MSRTIALDQARAKNRFDQSGLQHAASVATLLQSQKKKDRRAEMNSRMLSNAHGVARGERKTPLSII